MTKNQLNILFITQDDPFYVPYFFLEFIDIFNDPDICIKGIVIQTPLGKKSFANLAKQMFDFYGIVDFVRLGIHYTTTKIFNLVAIKIFKGKFWGVFSVEHLLLKKVGRLFILMMPTLQNLSKWLKMKP